MIDTLLIRPNVTTGNVIPPLGLGYLAANLRKRGYVVSIQDCLKENLSIRNLVSIVKKENPLIIGITICTNEIDWVRLCIEEIRKFSSVKIIVGGPHPTGLKREIFNDLKGIDFAIYSEGELALLLLVEAISCNRLDANIIDKIPNLIWKKGTDIMENISYFQEDIDNIDFPAWQLIRPDTYPKRPHGGFIKAYPFAPLITSRGCPYPCQFCAAPIIQGNKVRQRSPNNIIEEIKLLVMDYDVKEIHIEDDNFTFFKDFVIEFCEALLNAELDVIFSLPNGIRIDRIDKEMLLVMKKAGFYSIAVGIESGSQKVLDRMRKKLELGLVKEKILLIKKYGFIVKGFFMLGYPSETKEEMESTLRLSKELPLDLAFFSAFIPLPGTPEYNRLVKEKEFQPRKVSWAGFYTGDLKNLPYSPIGLEKAELKKYVFKAIKGFYLRPGIIFRLLLQLNSNEQVKFLMTRARKLIFEFWMEEKESIFSLFLKRVWDISFSILGLILSLPLWIVISWAIYLEDRSPVIFYDFRLTQDKRSYRHFKFRSMVKHAEVGTGPIWSRQEDRRITKIGRFLRATALDELPQLWNILKGDMSFVGPRPERPFFVEKFLKEIPGYEKRFSVRPGLTGMAQVYGKYDTPPEKKLQYDLEYIRKMNIFLDLKLIFLSFIITLRGGWTRFEVERGEK